jgi:nicotinamide-nucleotide amidase
MPSETLTAEIVTTGTEILLGDIVDTNAAWIAQQLRDAGVNLYYKSTVGDNEARIRGVVAQALGRSDVVIVTGGLGPTVDDVTRQAIAAATGRELLLDEDALRTLEARFARFGSPMTANNRVQAMIPAGATLIPNPMGTAPGFIVEEGGRAVIAVPGVPREMKAMLENTVLPWLRARTGAAVIRRRILRTIGMGESAIDDLLGDLMHGANPTVGLAAHLGQVDVRIAARADDAGEADGLLDALEEQVRARLGNIVYSATPGEPFEAVVARALRDAGVHAVLLETNTGGNIAARLRDVGDKEGFDPVAHDWHVGSAEMPRELAEALSARPDPLDPTQENAEIAARAIRAFGGPADLGVAWSPSLLYRHLRRVDVVARREGCQAVVDVAAERVHNGDHIRPRLRETQHPARLPT